MHARRFYIVGAAGSGKTTLAFQLAQLLKVPVYELDVVFYEGGFGLLYPLEIRNAEIGRIVAQPAWIVEGGTGYLKDTEQFLEAADTIIWLDLPWRIIGWRIILRHIKADLAHNNRHPGYRKLYRFFLDSREFFKNTGPITIIAHENALDTHVNRTTTAYFLEHYAQKLVRCRHQADVRKLLRSFQ